MYSTDTEIKLDVLTRELREDKQSQEQQNQTLSPEQNEEVEEEIYGEGVDIEDSNPMDSFIELPWPPSQWY